MKKIILLLAFLFLAVFVLFGCTKTGPNSLDYNNSVISVDEQNYVFDLNNGLVWLRCDYGRAGKECNIPNYCGYDGTSQDSYTQKSDNDPVCSSEKNYGKTLKASCNPILANSRYVYTDDSGKAVCDNGVLCKDGSFIVVDWREDFGKFEEEYSPLLDVMRDEYEIVPNSAKERACKNHGGVATFANAPIYDWRLPSVEELQTLYDPEFKGINTNLFPNSSKRFLSTTPEIGVGTTINSGAAQSIFFDLSEGGKIENCLAEEPIKCVFKVGKQNTSSSFCKTESPKKFHINYNEVLKVNDEPARFYPHETWILFEKDFTKVYREWAISNHTQNGFVLSNYPKKDYIYEDKINNEISFIMNEWEFDYESATEKWDNVSFPLTDNFESGDLIHPGKFLLLPLEIDYITNEKKIVNGVECYLTKGRNGIRECISKEYCMIIEEMFIDNYDQELFGETINHKKKFEVLSIKTTFDESILEFDYENNTVESIEQTEIDNQIDDDTGNACAEHCEEMRISCESQGMDYTYDGCVPFCEGANCPYHRNCELSCYSN